MEKKKTTFPSLLSMNDLSSALYKMCLLFLRAKENYNFSVFTFNKCFSKKLNRISATLRVVAC